MTILQSLDRYYARMAARGEAEAPGFSRKGIGFAIVLSAQGTPVDVLDLRQTSGRKLVPRILEVPAAVKRTAGISPNFLWDKSAYVLARTAGKGRRTAEEHAAFRALHLERLSGIDDPGLMALCRFLEGWDPARFDQPPFRAEMLDADFVFRLEGDLRFLHERPAALALLAPKSTRDGPTLPCLVTGQEGHVRRLHPDIKGVESKNPPPGGGHSLVSFNLEAFTSYGKSQGDNAPTSEAAAFRYGAALNRMLDRGSPNRLRRPLGDATVVFWADAGAAEETAQAAEDIFALLSDPPAPAAPGDEAGLQRDAAAARRVQELLDTLAEGRPLRTMDARLEEGLRFHVLGLSPNAARLSVRFWLTDSFGAFARRLARHYQDLAIAPPPWRGTPPSVGRLLVNTTALQGKFDNIPPLLAGEVMRAVLSGTAYPRSLLSAVLLRLRAGDDPATGWHAAALRAVLAREHRLRRGSTPEDATEKETPPVSLDREEPSAAYQLGRMFAMAEIAQRMALGTVNATIRDRYFGAASATPAQIFPLLLRGMQNHLSKLRKAGKGGFVEREMDQIATMLPPALPRSLRLEEQGRFVIGYYHQRQARIAGKAMVEQAEAEAPEGESTNE